MKYQGGVLNALKKIEAKEALEKVKMKEKMEVMKEIDKMKDSNGLVNIQISADELTEIMNNRLERKKKPATERQLATRMKFSMANIFVNQIRELLSPLNRSGKKDVISSLVSKLIKEGFRGEYPLLEIDYAKVEMGSNAFIYNPELHVLTKRMVFLSWDFPDPTLGTSADDQVTILIYNIYQKKFIWEGFVRKIEERILIKMESANVGDRFAAFVFVKGQLGSILKYMGEHRFR